MPETDTGQIDLGDDHQLALILHTPPPSDATSRYSEQDTFGALWEMAHAFLSEQGLVSQDEAGTVGAATFLSRRRTHEGKSFKAGQTVPWPILLQLSHIGERRSIRIASQLLNQWSGQRRGAVGNMTTFPVCIPGLAKGNSDTLARCPCFHNGLFRPHALCVEDAENRGDAESPALDVAAPHNYSEGLGLFTNTTARLAESQWLAEVGVGEGVLDLPDKCAVFRSDVFDAVRTAIIRTQGAIAAALIGHSRTDAEIPPALCAALHDTQRILVSHFRNMRMRMARLGRGKRGTPDGSASGAE